jgi:hypothetical protein
MRPIFTGGAVAVLAAAAALLAPAAAGASAHGAARLAPKIERITNRSCPSRTVCTFSETGQRGAQGNIYVPDYHSAWINFTSVTSFDPGSLWDNSGSDIWVAFSDNSEECFTDGDTPNFGSGPGDPNGFFIQYNVDTCATLPPAPPK